MRVTWLLGGIATLAAFSVSCAREDRQSVSVPAAEPRSAEGAQESAATDPF